METVRRREERITPTNVEFEKIEEMPTMDAVRKYLNWDAEVNPLPGEVKWYADDKTTWQERRQKHLDKIAQEKEEKRMLASNPSKPRVPSQKFTIVEFLAEKELKHDPIFLGMFQMAMIDRKLPSAPLAIYEKLWDKFIKESDG